MTDFRALALGEQASGRLEGSLALGLVGVVAIALIDGDPLSVWLDWGSLWPASALATWILILAPARRMLLAFLLVAAILAAVHGTLGGAWHASVLFGASTATGAWVVTLADPQRRWTRLWEARPSDLLRFLAAVAAASLAASVVAAAGLALLGQAGAAPPAPWWVRPVVDGVAVVVFVPGLLALARLRSLPSDSRLIEGGAALLLLAVLSAVLFSGLPGLRDWELNMLLAALAPAILWVALRAPPPLAMLAPAILALFTAWGVAKGAGPFAPLAERGMDAALLPVQAFLVAAALLAFVPCYLAARQHAAEARLRASEGRIAQAAAVADLGVFERDPDGDLQLCPSVRTIFGLPEDGEAAVADLLARVLPEDRPRAAAAFAEGSGPDGVEYRIDRGAGGLRWLLQKSGPLAPPGPGGAAHHVGAVMDITERKQAEQALREREGRIRSLLSAVTGAVVTMDGQGVVTAFDATAERMFGYPAAEVLGGPVGLLFPEGRLLDPAGGRSGRRPVSAQPPLGSRELTARRRDGASFVAEVSLGAAQADDRTILTAVIRDLTDRQAVESRLKRLQTELMYSARIGNLERMAPSLAHELMQPLTAMANYATTSRDLLPADGPGDRALLGEILEEIAAQAMRAGQIVRSLRDFASHGDGSRRPETLADVVAAAKALALAGPWDRRVRVSERIDESLRVFVDRVQIQQVLVNLIRNAMDAMAERTRRELHISVRRSMDRWVEVRVSDTGPGVAPDLAGQLFKPFVTTKEDGMGLGLSLCKDIIEDHGGLLWIENRHPHGATFAFTLPCHVDEAEHA